MLRSPRGASMAERVGRRLIAAALAAAALGLIPGLAAGESSGPVVAPPSRSAAPTAEQEYNRGLRARASRDWPGAVGAFGKAIELRPAFPEAWNELGYALRHQGRYDESVRAYDEALNETGSFIPGESARQKGARAAQALAHGFRRHATDLGRFGRLQSLDCDEQQRLAVRGGKGGQRGRDSLLGLACFCCSQWGWSWRAGGPQADEVPCVRLLEQSGATVAHVQAAGDREQPRGQAGVGPEAMGMPNEPQPGLFEQILGDVPAVCQPDQKVEQPHVVRAVHGIKSVRIAIPQTADDLQLELTVHRGTNADDREA